MPILPMLLVFSWDRDAGAIGMGPLDAMIDNDHPSLQVRGVICNSSGYCSLIGDRVPKTFSDIPTPPSWPAANPKPKPATQPATPGQFLQP
jgi:hypothetical protein